MPQRNYAIACPTCHYEHTELTKAEMRRLEKEWRVGAVARELMAALKLSAAALLATHPEKCREGTAYCQCAHAKAWRTVTEAIKKAEAL